MRTTLHACDRKYSSCIEIALAWLNTRNVWSVQKIIPSNCNNPHWRSFAISSQPTNRAFNYNIKKPSYILPKVEGNSCHKRKDGIFCIGRIPSLGSRDWGGLGNNLILFPNKSLLFLAMNRIGSLFHVEYKTQTSCLQAQKSIWVRQAVCRNLTRKQKG